MFVRDMNVIIVVFLLLICFLIIVRNLGIVDVDIFIVFNGEV